MARLKLRCHTQNGDKPFTISRLGDLMAESQITTMDPESHQLVTEVKTSVYEDGSGLIVVARGGRRFRFLWSEEGLGELEVEQVRETQRVP